MAGEPAGAANPASCARPGGRLDLDRARVEPAPTPRRAGGAASRPRRASRAARANAVLTPSLRRSGSASRARILLRLYCTRARHPLPRCGHCQPRRRSSWRAGRRGAGRRVRQLLRQLGADGGGRADQGAAGHAIELVSGGGGGRTLVAWAATCTTQRGPRPPGCFRACVLGIVPMGVPATGLAEGASARRAVTAGLAAALRGIDRVIDAGSLNGRLSFNAAGPWGSMPTVADVFAARRNDARNSCPTRRVVPRAVRPTARPVVAATLSPSCTCRAPLISIANTPAVGSGARIAPAALMDDERSTWSRCGAAAQP